MAPHLSTALEHNGDVKIEVLSDILRVPVAELAESIGVDVLDIDCEPTARSPGANKRLAMLVELLRMTAPWAGSVEMAWAHYRSYPIPALGSLTAEALLVRGRSEELSEYLRHIEDGGYA